MGKRQSILRSAVAAGIAGLRSETSRVINIRRRDLDDQMLELRSLRGKNASVIDSMRTRIEQEQREFEMSTAKIQAVRAVHLKLLRDIFHELGARSLKAELALLTDALQQKGLKLGVRKIYAETFQRLQAIVDKAQSSGTEIHAMLGGTFRQLNTDFGFSPKCLRLRNWSPSCRKSRKLSSGICSTWAWAMPSNWRSLSSRSDWSVRSACGFVRCLSRSPTIWSSGANPQQRNWMPN